MRHLNTKKTTKLSHSQNPSTFARSPARAPRERPLHARPGHPHRPVRRRSRQERLAHRDQSRPHRLLHQQLLRGHDQSGQHRQAGPWQRPQVEVSLHRHARLRADQGHHWARRHRQSVRRLRRRGAGERVRALHWPVGQTGRQKGIYLEICNKTVGLTELLLNKRNES